MRRGTPARGLFITFEGIEGSGKTTQIQLLGEYLRETGREVMIVREPGGTDLGEALRGLLLAVDSEGIDPRAELFLYLASRAQLVARRIVPALEGGTIVLADRYGDASVAYQGAGRRLGTEEVRALVRFATSGLTPDRTYLFDLLPEESLARVRSRGTVDRLEAELLPFHKKVRAAYRAIARAEPDRVHVIDGSATIDPIASVIRRDIDALMTARAHRARIRRS